MGQLYLNVSARTAITVCEQFSQKYQLAHCDTRKGRHSDKLLAKIGVLKFWPYCAQTGTNNARNNTNNARRQVTMRAK